MRWSEWGGWRVVAVAATAALCLALIEDGSAWGQELNSGAAINLGGRGWSASEAPADVPEHATNQLEYAVRGGFATDYMYRGTTLSDHKPAVGAAGEVTFAQFYAGVAVASVKLPTQPSAEIAMSAGVRRTIADINFDPGATYFLYPRETSVGGAEGVDYWEAAIRMDKRIAESVRIAGGFAYSPNVSNTGA